jgi:hypothetical protein
MAARAHKPNRVRSPSVPGLSGGTLARSLVCDGTLVSDLRRQPRTVGAAAVDRIGARGNITARSAGNCRPRRSGWNSIRCNQPLPGRAEPVAIRSDSEQQPLLERDALRIEFRFDGCLGDVRALNNGRHCLRYDAISGCWLRGFGRKWRYSPWRDGTRQPRIKPADRVPGAVDRCSFGDTGVSLIFAPGDAWSRQSDNSFRVQQRGRVRWVGDRLHQLSAAWDQHGWRGRWLRHGLNRSTDVWLQYRGRRGRKGHGADRALIVRYDSVSSPRTIAGSGFNCRSGTWYARHRVHPANLGVCPARRATVPRTNCDRGCR